MKAILTTLAVLMFLGCSYAGEIVLVESETTWVGPSVYVYKDTVTGSRIVFFCRTNAGGAVILPPKPEEKKAP